MERMPDIIERIKRDLSSEKPVDEIFQSLRPMLEEDPHHSGTLAELLVSIPDKRVAQLLLRVAEVTSDKKVRKTIKRSLYRLKSKGVMIEENLSEKESTIFRPFAVDSKEGFASAIDTLGQRVLWLVLPQSGRGLSVMYGVVSDQDGVIDFFCQEVTRKGFRVFFKEVQEKNPFPFVKVEPSYIAFLLHQAYQLNLKKTASLPQDYLRSKNEIEGIKKDYAKPLIYFYLSAQEIAGDDSILRRTGELLKTDVFLGWRIEEDLIRPYAEEILVAEQSRIVLSQTQKEARFQGIYQKALTELFTEERRLLYQRRLEEMAYVLFQMGREEEAKLSLSAAIDLEKPLDAFQPHPFPLQLVMKSILSLLAESEKRRSKEVSLIVKP